MAMGFLPRPVVGFVREGCGLHGDADERLIPVDDITLDILESACQHAYTDQQAAAIAAGEDPPPGEMNLSNVLDFLGGYDGDVLEPSSFSECDVILALIGEVRRLRLEVS
jgi:hypothetical protein